jgi:hypothetical protein
MSGTQSQTGGTTSFLGPFNYALEYMIDATQRSILFWDVMRQRGNAYREHMAKTAPHVLDYRAELVLDGRTFDRPVNYVLARIIPPDGHPEFLRGFEKAI